MKHNNKWYECGHKPTGICLGFVIKDDDNFVHMMKFGDEERLHHWKVSLFDLLPQSIIELNRQRYDVLICGFIKEFEQRKKIIVNFYPVFI